MVDGVLVPDFCWLKVLANRPCFHHLAFSYKKTVYTFLTTRKDLGWLGNKAKTAKKNLKLSTLQPKPSAKKYGVPSPEHHISLKQIPNSELRREEIDAAKIIEGAITTQLPQHTE